ncbi:MAG: type II toxin-antitoxin system prevent-host-death family antitoxin [Gammaproteobacteria bacterium]|nr:type II toxin-antitoxin system prevent-host-death family antitoxin [Gammaproteobacteria bacterium]MYC52484.1 type II toxin-antitoxin system prevent-host-death family antitoxin [Gammaproteobacteria bacterium]
MSSTINVKTLRNEMGRIIERVRKGEDFTVLYRSRPAFRIVPLSGVLTHGVAEDDSLYRAEAVGRSDDGLTAEEHDRSLYGWPRA